MQIGTQICTGLKALHSMGVIHRDLNLGNIIRGPDGHITLLDLGLAKRLPGFRGVVGSLTHPDLRVVTGDMKIGTPGFVPPEADVTERYDVYGLGGVLYALHTRKGFARDLAVLAEIEDDELSDLLPELLAPDPQLRYTLAEASNHMESIVVARTGDVPECAELPDDPKPTPARTWLRWLDLAGLAVAAVATGLLLFEMGAKSSAVAPNPPPPLIVVRDAAERGEDTSAPKPELTASPQLQTGLEPVSREEPQEPHPKVSGGQDKLATAPDPVETTTADEDQRAPKKRRSARKSRSQIERDFRAALKERIRTCIAPQAVKYSVNNGSINLEFSSDVSRMAQGCVRQGLDSGGSFSGELRR